MSALLKKFLVLSSLFVVFFVPPVHAEEASASSLPTLNSQLSTTLPLPSYIPQTSPVYTDLMIFNMFHTFSCLAVGGSIIGQPCVTYQFQKNTQGLIQSVPVLS